MENVVIGLDFGSLSCRGILAGASDGRVLAEEVCPYRHGILEALPDGGPVPAGYVLQDPRDFKEALFRVIRGLLGSPRSQTVRVSAIGLDATASTVIPVRKDLTPLCASPDFMHNPDAFAVMWKDHRAVQEANLLTEALRKADPARLGRFGGSIGAEALIAKVLHICRNAPQVYQAAFALMEAGDWLTSLLTGRPALSKTMLTCKNLFRHGSGFPEAALFRTMDSRLGGIPDKLMPWSEEEVTLGYPGQNAGRLSGPAAEELGLPESAVVTFAQMDGYAGLVGAGISEPGRLALTCGTSSGFFMLSDRPGPVEGVCAAVPDSMVPGYTGIAAGQASTGDAFAWFVNSAVPPAYFEEARKHGTDIHGWLCECVRRLPADAPRLLALDWMNGNKSPLNRPDLSGVILGLTLETRPEQIYLAMMEAAAFGARHIIETIEKQHIPVSGITAAGGIPHKNALLMQIYADVLRKPIELIRCRQTAAMGSAVAAAVAASDGYSRWAEAVSGMKPARAAVYMPDPSKKRLYDRLYQAYLSLSGYFAHQSTVMGELRECHASLQGGLYVSETI